MGKMHKVTLSDQAMTLIIRSLAQHPYKDVAAVIADLHKQMQQSSAADMARQMADEEARQEILDEEAAAESVN